MKTTPLTYARAKSMRREPTEAERKLWGGLRKRCLGNFKFARQQPIGPYIVDFICRKERLIVEVDGAMHGDDVDVAYDNRRTQFLEAQGYRVIRVDSHEVFTDIGAVLDYIANTHTQKEGTSSALRAPSPRDPRGKGKL